MDRWEVIEKFSSFKGASALEKSAGMESCIGGCNGMKGMELFLCVNVCFLHIMMKLVNVRETGFFSLSLYLPFKQRHCNNKAMF